MELEDNVECVRCGRQWHSTEYREENTVPELCNYCYRNSVQEIPAPPTKMEKTLEKVEDKKDEIPGIISQKKHRLVLWKENNSLLLGMIATGTIMLSILSIITYFLFF